jgi:Ca2+-binding RTX toxin-like protein
LIGTDQEDFMAGGASDDSFVVGLGNDGIHGGDGIDTLELPGDASGYTIRQMDDGYLVAGYGSEKFALSIERFVFGDGKELSLDAFLGVPPSAPAEPEIPPSDETLFLEPVEPAVRVTAATASDTAETTPALAEGAVSLTATADSVSVDGNQGRIVDGADRATISIDEGPYGTKGYEIRAVNPGSELGRALSSQGEDVEDAFAIYQRGKIVEVDLGSGERQSVKADYFSVQSNQAGRDGGRIEDDALVNSLQFAEIVMNVAGLSGSSGNDRLFGRGSADVLDGAAGRDFIKGGAGNDVLRGGDGSDRIIGGAGNDVLDGGSGGDILTGGRGSDRFYFTAGSGIDRITDFDAADTLDLRGFFSEPESLSDLAVRNRAGDLVVTNGEDRILLEGWTLDALDWITIA